MSFDAATLKERRKFVGASEVAAILGMSPYRDQSELAIWYEKCSTDEPEVKEDTPVQRWGKDLEAAIVRETALMHGLDTRATCDSPEGQQTFVDRGGIIRAQPDGIGWTPGVVTPGKDDFVLEAKLVGLGMRNRWLSPDEAPAEVAVPEYVRVQVEAQMAASDIQKAIIGMSTGMLPNTYLLTGNPKSQELLRALIGEWWEKYVVKQVPPPVRDGTKNTHELIQRIYPGKVGEKLFREAQAAENLLVEQWLKARSAAKEAAKNASYLEAKVKEAIANDTGLETAYGRLAWSVVAEKRGPVAKKVIAWVEENHPEVLKQMEGVQRKGHRQLATRGVRLAEDDGDDESPAEGQEV